MKEQHQHRRSRCALGAGAMKRSGDYSGTRHHCETPSLRGPHTPRQVPHPHKPRAENYTENRGWKTRTTRDYTEHRGWKVAL